MCVRHHIPQLMDPRSGNMYRNHKVGVVVDESCLMKDALRAAQSQTQVSSV